MADACELKLKQIVFFVIQYISPFRAGYIVYHSFYSKARGESEKRKEREYDLA